MRDYYAEPLPAVFEAFMKSKVTQGTYIWCWADDMFCVPDRGIEFGRDVTQCFFVGGSYGIRGRGIVGDAPWGVIDSWQRRKPEFWITKKVHSPIKVKETPLPLPGADGVVKVPVENQYDFRNLSDLRVLWALGSQQGESKADVPPRSTGEIAIHPDQAVEGRRDALARIPRGRRPADRRLSRAAGRRAAARCPGRKMLARAAGDPSRRITCKERQRRSSARTFNWPSTTPPAG